MRGNGSTVIMKKGITIAWALLALFAGCSRSDEKWQTPLVKETGDANVSQRQPYYEGLIEEYRNNLAEDPHNRAATIALANAFYDSGDWKAAIQYYERALRLDPHDADILTDLGTCYRNIGMSDRAVEEYRKALEYDPNHVNTLYNLGVVYAYDKKDYARAIHHWEALLRIAPTFHHANVMRESIAAFRKKLAQGGP